MRRCALDFVKGNLGERKEFGFTRNAEAVLKDLLVINCENVPFIGGAATRNDRPPKALPVCLMPQTIPV